MTKTEARWISIPLGTDGLSRARRDAALRARPRRPVVLVGGQRWLAKSERCRTLRPDGLDAREPLPFDLAVAQELYDQLLKPFADLTKGKSLIIVPSGPLTSLPFHVLVTEGAKTVSDSERLPDYRSAAWLALDATHHRAALGRQPAGTSQATRFAS